MSYIGVQPGVGQYRKLDDISGSFNGATTTFTTSVDGINVTAGSPQQLLVSVGGVIQQPVTDYSTSTNSITFSTAPAGGLDFFAVLMGDAINVGIPSDGSVTSAKLNSDLTIDLASGTAGAPSLTFDSDTGLYSPGANAVGIATNGTAAVTVDSSQKVGIGTTSPQSKASFLTTNVPGSNPTWSDSWVTFGPNVASSTGASIGIGYDGSGDEGYLVSLAPGVAFKPLKIQANVIGFGTGNGTEKARIDTSGRLLVGTSTARNKFYAGNATFTPAFQVERAANTDDRGTSFVYNSNNSECPTVILGKSRGTSVGSFTVVQNGDLIGRLSFQGADGTNLVEGATIDAFVDGAPGSNDLPTALKFSTTANGASSPTERLQINSTGRALFSNSTAVAPSPDNNVPLGLGSARWSAVYAANGTIQTSDQRAKTDITSSTLGRDFIKSLRPVSYKWIEGGKRDTGDRDDDNNYVYESVPGERTHWGFIAQEVKQAVDAAGVDFGGWVLIDKDDPDSQQALRYDQFIAPLTKALQEALEKIETLEQRLSDAGIA